MKNRQGRWGGKKWLDQNVWTLLKNVNHRLGSKY